MKSDYCNQCSYNGKRLYNNADEYIQINIMNWRYENSPQNGHGSLDSISDQYTKKSDLRLISSNWLLYIFWQGFKKKSNANCGRLIKNKIKGAIGKEAQMIWIWRIIFLYKNQNVKPITLVNFYTYIIDTYVYSF